MDKAHEDELAHEARHYCRTCQVWIGPGWGHPRETGEGYSDAAGSEVAQVRKDGFPNDAWDEA